MEIFASVVDHTLLDAAASPRDVDARCDEAARLGFASVCLHPWWVERAVHHAPGVRIGTVVAFPSGLDSTAGKIATAKAAIAAGAVELDVVMAWAVLAAGDDVAVGRDLTAVVDAVRREREDVTVKIIVEATQLDAAQLRAACAVVAECGADFAKTSTGTLGGARVDDVAAMRAALPKHIQIKASGGIRTAEGAEALLTAGADRLGTSSALEILAELDVRAVA